MGSPHVLCSFGVAAMPHFGQLVIPGQAIEGRHAALAAVSAFVDPTNQCKVVPFPATLHGPVGLMDKASASGAGDSRFESWAGHFVGRLWKSSYEVMKCHPEQLQIAQTVYVAS